jgi:2'-5' RNA ligase
MLFPWHDGSDFDPVINPLDQPSNTPLNPSAIIIAPLEDAELTDDEVEQLLSGDYTPLGLTAATQAIVADSSEHTEAMIALLPTQSDMDRLYVIGGEEDEELHVTLVYLGDAAKIPPMTRDRIVDNLMQRARNIPIIDGDLFGIATFNESDGKKDTCVVGLITGEELANAKKRIFTDLEDIMYDAPTEMPEQHTPWIPHVTLAYTNDGTLAPTLGDREGPVRFDRVRVAFGSEVTDIPLYDGTAKTDAVEDSSGY